MFTNVSSEVSPDLLWGLIRSSESIAGRLENTASTQFLQEIRTLTIDVPESASESGRYLIRQFIGSVLRALMVRAGPQCEAVVANRLVTLLSSLAGADAAWRADILSVIDACETALNISVSNPRPYFDSGLVEILAILDGRFRDSSLSLSVLAKEVDVSPWHIVRLLRVHTGRGFVGHLRERRVAEAGRLLQRTRLSGKQIAAEVGYRHARQLGRDFRQVCGMTPTAFRKSLLPQRVSVATRVHSFPAKAKEGIK